MWKQLVVGVVGLALVVAVAHLWLRVCELEQAVEALPSRSAGSPNAIQAEGRRESARTSAEMGEFRVNEALFFEDVPGGRSKVGVPWDVERAMLGQGNKQSLEISPRISQPLRAEWGEPMELFTPVPPSDIIQLPDVFDK